MTLNPSKLLLVEGIDDEKVIEKLMKRRKMTFDGFDIVPCNGINKMLNTLPVTLQSGNYSTVGVIIDADQDLSKRWGQVTSILRRIGYAQTPARPDAHGSMVMDDELPAVGIWLMPDNRLQGTIEDFIRFLVPADDKLLAMAQTKVDELVATQNNPFALTQVSKAVIHTWLAWQERPGTPLGSAVTYRLTNKKHLLDDTKADYFVRWLRKLFK